MASDKQKQLAEAKDQERKQDAYKLAVLIYDIYQDHKLKEKENGQSKRQRPSGIQGSP